MKHYTDVIKLIDEEATYFQTVKDNEAQYEGCEMRVTEAIFRYALQKGYHWDGIDLEKVLDAEDDEELPENGTEMLFKLMLRIQGNIKDQAPEGPQEIRDLLDYYSRAFYQN